MFGYKIVCLIEEWPRSRIRIWPYFVEPFIISHSCGTRGALGTLHGFGNAGMNDKKLMVWWDLGRVSPTTLHGKCWGGIQPRCDDDFEMGHLSSPGDAQELLTMRKLNLKAELGFCRGTWQFEEL